MALKNFNPTIPTDNDDNNNNPFNGGIPMSGPITLPPVDDEDDVLDLIINYNEKFKNEDDTLFRDETIKQTLSVLIGRDKPNPLLIGPAGVGKTKIVEDIAKKLANDDTLIPDSLKGYTIYELPLSNIVSGSSLVGQLEQKLKDVISFIKDKKNKAILFIDEIHLIMGRETYNTVAQILKPELARGEIKLITATTNQEVRSLDDDPAFNRRFTRIIVDELTRDQTTKILQHIKPTYENHYKNIIIKDDVLKYTAEIADNYFDNSLHRPDNAITLLDRTLANLIIDRNELLVNLEKEGNTQILDALKQNPAIMLSKKALQNTAINLITGHSKPEETNYEKLAEDFKKIKGQENIIEEIIKILKRKELNLFVSNEDENRQPLTILFAGQSGVGKTEIATLIAKATTGSKPITLNMTEFTSPAEINKIIGSPRGYIGSDSNEELPFDILATNPYQVILLDEFEKCHPSVKSLFMQVFDKGELKTNRGKAIDFSKSIIIATTNAGDNGIVNTIGFNRTDERNIQEQVSSLEEYFDPALLGRFDYLLRFNQISKNIYKEILSSTYENKIKKIKENQPHLTIEDTLTEEEINNLADKSFVANLGARPAKKTVENYIEEKVMDTL